MGDDVTRSLNEGSDRTLSLPGAQAPKGSLPPEVWESGHTVDAYEIKEKIGEGGMGIVHRVFHTGWNLDLAVKSPLPHFHANERLKKECEAWIELGLHPNIVQCYYVRDIAGSLRIFMEYVGGEGAGTLREWIDQGKLRGNWERILDIAIQICDGLACAHEKGMVHRDLKPGNILITPDGEAKIADWGLVKWRKEVGEDEGGQRVPLPREASGTLARGIVGTPEYMAPEQWIPDAEVDHRADIWALGVILHEMAKGSKPWVRQEGEPPAAFRARQIHSHDEGVHIEVIPAMPEEVASLLGRCLQGDTAKRPRNTDEPKRALREAYAKVSGQAYPRAQPRAADLLADSLNNRAVSLIDLGRMQEAEKALDQALAAEPMHLHATYNHGLLQWRTAQIADDALRVRVGEACALAGTWEGPWLAACVEIERGDYESASGKLQEAERLAGSHKFAQDRLARARDGVRGGSRCLRTLEGHTDTVRALAITPCGRLLVSGSGDNTVRVWELATGRCLWTLEGHHGSISAISLTPDGTRAISGSSDRTLRVWDLEAGRCLWTLEGHNAAVTAVALTPDGRLAVSGSDNYLGGGSLCIWDLARGRCLRDSTMGFDCQLVTVIGDALWAVYEEFEHRLALWEFRSYLRKEPDVHVHGLSGREHKGRVNAVALTRDGLAISGSTDKKLRVWEVGTGHCLRTLDGHMGAVNAVALTLCGRRAVSGGGDATLRVWDAATGRCLRTLEHSDRTCSPGRREAVPRLPAEWGGARLEGVTTVVLTADGRLAVSGGSDHAIRVWEIGTGRAGPYELISPRRVQQVYSGERKAREALKAAARSMGQGATSAVISHLAEARSVPGYARSPEALDIARQLAQVTVRGDLRGAWTMRILEGHEYEVRAVAITPDGRLALSGSDVDKTLRTSPPTETPDASLRVWEVATGRCLRALDGAYGVVTAVALTSDGRLALASVQRSGLLGLWDVKTGEILREEWNHNGAYVRALAVTPDGRLALTGTGEHRRIGLREPNAWLWEVGSLEALSTQPHYHTQSREWREVYLLDYLRKLEGHGLEVTAVAMTFDGRLGISGSADKTLRVWDLTFGRCTRVLEGHTGGVRAVALAADGRLAVSASDDFSVRVWDVATGRCLRTLEGHAGPVHGLSLTPDGTIAVSGSWDKTLRVWEVETGRCLSTLEGHTAEVNGITITGDGHLVVSGSSDRSVRVWYLDWERICHETADWDEGARTFVETFLTSHTPFGCVVREHSDILIRQGAPCWTDSDFQELIRLLQWIGYGWLRPESVRRKLEELARVWPEQGEEIMRRRLGLA